jgi:hypothetical protein
MRTILSQAVSLAEIARVLKIKGAAVNTIASHAVDLAQRRRIIYPPNLDLNLSAAARRISILPAI